MLISGAEDGQCIVWDVLSRQPLRKFDNHKGPVTFVSCFLRPVELHPDAASQTILPMPWKQLKRAIATSEEEHRNGSDQLIQDNKMVTILLLIYCNNVLIYLINRTLHRTNNLCKRVLFIQMSTQN